MRLLCVDAGTTRTKVGIYTSGGKVVYKTYRSRTTSEVSVRDPNEWWNETVELIKEAMSVVGDIDAVGLTGNMHALLPVDKNGVPLMKAVLWNDTRADPKLIFKAMREGELLEKFMNPLVPAFPLLKIVWLKEFIPSVFEDTYKFIQPKDFLALKLTGKFVTDRSDASGTMAFNMKSLEWDADVLRRFGIPLDKFPTVLKSFEIVGGVSREASRLTGLKFGTPVVIGAGDLITSLLGSGAEFGDIVINIGTAGQILMYSSNPSNFIGKLFVFLTPFEGHFLALGTVPSGGYSLEWLSRVLECSVEELLEASESSPVGSNGVVFLPFILGAGTPAMKYEKCGVFWGMKDSTGRGDLGRAVAEGVVFSLISSIERAKARPTRMVLQSRAVLRVFSEAIGCLSNASLLTSDDPDSSLKGAAILAAYGLGEYPSLEEAITSMVKHERLKVEAECPEILERNFDIFRKLAKIYEEVERS